MLTFRRAAWLVSVVPPLLVCAAGCGGTVRSTAADGGSGPVVDAASPRSDAQADDAAGLACTTVAGSCLYTLASGQDHPSSLALDQGTLYWTNERAGTVMKVATAGGTPVTLATKAEQGLPGVPSTDGLPTRIGPLVVAPPSLYWWAVSDTLSIGHSCPMTGPCNQSAGAAWPMSVLLSGGASASLGLSVGGPVPSPMSGVAANADGFFLASGGGWIVGTSTVEAGDGSTPFGVVADTHNIYWTDRTAGTVTTASTVGDGVGPGTALATGQAQPSLLAVDTDSLYWTNAGDGSVVKVPKGGGATTVIAQGQTSPFGIAVSASGVYWTDRAGTVMKAPLAGGAPVTLASGQSTPYAIALDGTSVYFTNYASNGSVMKLTESCSCP
jgi:hypothetical protein